MWFVKSKRASSVDDYETWIENLIVPTLNRMDNNGESYATVLILKEENVDQLPTVRRLIPVECERLQGFPDNWTAGQADSSRYKQMGNAVAVPVVSWIAERMVARIGDL